MGCNSDALLAQKFMGWGISERIKHTRQLQVCSQSKLIICSRDKEGGEEAMLQTAADAKAYVRLLRWQWLELVDSSCSLQQLRGSLRDLVRQDVVPLRRASLSAPCAGEDRQAQCP